MVAAAPSVVMCSHPFLVPSGLAADIVSSGVCSRV
jgi:hypothetical protein